MGDGSERDAAANGGGRGGEGNGSGSEGSEDGGGSLSGGNDGGSRSGGNDGGSRSGGNGGGGTEGRDDENGGEGSGTDEPTWVQTAVVILSVAFAVVLFAYAGWQTVASPSTEVPEAAVVDAETMPDGRVAVTVGLRNPTGVGLVSATVEARCADPPPSAALSYVPADSTRTATLVCPPGTTDPDVAVSDWVSR